MFPRYYYGCSIPDGQSVVLTGGELTGSLVSRYTRYTIYTTGCPKKMSFSEKTVITTFKLIQNAKVGGVSENSGYLLPHGHRDFQN